MSQRILAASLVTLWLAFLGLECLGTPGLDVRGRANIEASVEAVPFASFAPAEIADDKFTAEPDGLSIFSSLPGAEPVPSRHLAKATNLVRNSPRIYELHAALLL